LQIKSIGIDLGKTTFHLIALGTRAQVVIRKKFSRSQLLEYTANLPSSLIGMEAGVGSHFLGRALREQEHQVRLIPAQFVRPFVKSNKNLYRDAEAIAEAVERENMRFRIHFSQTVLAATDSSCSSAADHTCYVSYPKQVGRAGNLPISSMWIWVGPWGAPPFNAGRSELENQLFRLRSAIVALWTQAAR
jgi:hypothetical protein